MKPSQTIYQRRPLRTGLGLALFTSGMVSALADLAHTF
jgi:energy-converting hydrogenase Eha subunit C